MERGVFYTHLKEIEPIICNYIIFKPSVLHTELAQRFLFRDLPLRVIFDQAPSPQEADLRSAVRLGTVTDVGAILHVMKNGRMKFHNELLAIGDSTAYDEGMVHVLHAADVMHILAINMDSGVAGFPIGRISSLVHVDDRQNGQFGIIRPSVFVSEFEPVPYQVVRQPTWITSREFDQIRNSPRTIHTQRRLAAD